MASITARRSVLRGRPPALGGGRSGAITAHSRSVMSLGYRADTRLWSWRVVSSQAIGSSASQSGGGITTHWYHSTPFRPGSEESDRKPDIKTCQVSVLGNQESLRR